jgi:hypothetical protein
MRRNLWVGCLALGTLAVIVTAGPGQAPPRKDGPPAKGGAAAPALPGVAPLVRLAPQARTAKRALMYRLLPDELDLVPGNAAPLWLRAGRTGLNVRHKITPQEYAWAGPAGVPLDKLPRKEVRAFLDRYAGALRLAEQAALRKRCDWDWLPLTVQNLPDLPLDEIQSVRHLAFLLSVRFRLELSQGRFDRAAGTLRVGFTLAQHLGNSDILIQDLVGIAIATIMLGGVEEWLQCPGSPNLYWPLTALPRPFIDVRRSIRAELGTLYRSFPQLRELKKTSLSADQVRALADKLVTALAPIAGGGAAVPPWAGRLGMAAVAAKHYPDARAYLLGHGYTARQLDAMPALQVVILSFLDDYDRVRDDLLKWLSVPAWQGRAALDRLSRQVQASRRVKGPPVGNVFLVLLLPAIDKVHAAHLRLERHIAGFRGAEALRQYAADHGGKAPAKWADITKVPLPLDPFTGKGFDAFYSVKGGTATLAVPPPPGMPPPIGRHYVLPGKGGKLP